MSIQEQEFNKLEFADKESTIDEIKKIFKGNIKFINYAKVLIYSTENFIQFSSFKYLDDTWDWEKLLIINIRTTNGFKMLIYRKGNEKYKPSWNKKGNDTWDVNEYKVFIHNSETRLSEEYVL